MVCFVVFNQFLNMREAEIITTFSKRGLMEPNKLPSLGDSQQSYWSQTPNWAFSHPASVLPYAASGQPGHELRRWACQTHEQGVTGET